MSQSKRNKKLELASWNLPEVVRDYYKRQGVELMFPWQVQCLQTGTALQGGNLLYSAPTSAGKTLVAEILALKRILKTKRKGIFILPFVSVAREKMFSLRSMYSGLGLTVGGFMGAQTPPGGFKRVDIAVCTIERANSLINRLLEAGKLSQLAVIVVDELHMVGDPSRGCLIEPLLTKVNFHVANTASSEDDPAVQIIGMSATLPNMHVLAKWLEADLYCTDFRPVPLTEYVKIGSSILNAQLEYVRDIEAPGAYDNDSEMIVNLCLETIRNKKSVLIFCPAKEWCERLCTTIAKSFYMIMAGKCETSAVLGPSVNEAIDKDRIMGLLEQLKRCPAGLVEHLRTSISYGVAFHHAGLTLEEKDIIEAGFRKSVIRILIATTTLSSGVNLPAQRVIIRSPLFMGKSMDALTYKQMVGRAGRKGIDTSGESILICKPSEKALVRELLNSDLPAAKSQLIRKSADGDYTLRPSVKRALLEMIASGSAKTIETMNKYINCTLLAAEIESNSGNTELLVKDCLKSLQEDEFINITSNSDGSENLSPTQLGSAVFASSMNPDDSLTILCDLNKARKQFVLENDLHMVYQVTPINSIHQNIDWVKYLNLWESLPIDQQRVGELVGVSERFITLSHQGRRRRQSDKQRRSLQIHKRFYTALVLHDLVNETPLVVIEKKYGVNKGAVQALQQSAAIFAGMICTFCIKLGWTPLRLLLADFQQRLDTGVRRELVDLVRISSLDAKKARHFYNSGLQTVSDVVNSTVEHLTHLLDTFLPFESAKQGFGETEWELKERTSRKLFIKGRNKSLTLVEAAQAILEEAQEVLQQDLDILGVQAVAPNQSHSLSTSISSVDGADGSTVIANGNNTLPHPSNQRQDKASTPNQTPANVSISNQNPANAQTSSWDKANSTTSNQSSASSSTSNQVVANVSATNQRANDASTCNQSENNTSTSNQITAVASSASNQSLSNSLASNQTLSDAIANRSATVVGTAIVNDPNNSQIGVKESFAAQKSHKRFNFTQIKKSPPSDNEVVIADSQENKDFAFGVTSYRQLLNSFEKCTNTSTGMSPIAVIDAEVIENNVGAAGDQSACADPETPRSETADTSSVLWGDSFLFPSQVSSTGLSQNSRGPSPVGQVSMESDNPNKSLGLLTDILDEKMSVDSAKSRKRDLLSPDLTFTRLKRSKRIRTSTIDGGRRGSQSSCPNSPLRDEQLINGVTPKSHGSAMPAADCLVTPIQKAQRSLSVSAWSLSETFQMESSAVKEVSSSKNATSGSNDLFSKSMDSLIWSPMSDAAHTTPTGPKSLLDRTKSTSNTDVNTNSAALSLDSEVLELNSPSKLKGANKIDIVDVAGDLRLFETFMSDWTEATEYSMCLACDLADLQSTQEEESIGFHSSASTSTKGESKTRLSTSAIQSDEGILLHQYGVVVVGLAVTIKSVVFYIDLTHDIGPKLLAISKVLSLSHSTKVLFDSKEQIKRLSSLLGVSVKIGTVIDPKVIMWLLNPAEKEHNLIGVIHKAAPWLSSIVTANIGACIGNGSIGLRPHATTSSRLRACYESLAMMAVLRPLLTLLEEHGLDKAFTSIEMPHLDCLTRMETEGLGFDVKEFDIQGEKIQKCLHIIETKAHTYSKRGFDLGSPKDIGEVLFVELRLPYDRKKVVSKRGAPWSTAQAQLEKITSLHPLPGLVLVWRRLHSALKTLVHPLNESKVWCVSKCMYRIYSTCSIHTSTGRITMHEPNLQTVNKDIPVLLEDTPEEVISLRNAFPAAPGYTLLSADYSQLELRIISHLALDPTLLSLLNAGGDVFKDIASRWKSVPVDEVSDEQRQCAKQICYGIIYGMGSKALAEQLVVDEDTAEQLMNDFQATFTGLKRYILSTIESCRQLGYVSSIAGRRRYLPLINSNRNRGGRSQAERQAVHTTVQGSAADLVKLATVNLSKSLHRDAKLVLQIHDELLYEVPTSELTQTAHIMKQTMESVGVELNLRVNMVVRLKAGPTWGQLQTLEIS